MGHRYGLEFRVEAVRLALTSGLTRKQLAADLGIGFSTLNKSVQQDRPKDLMSGPHAIVRTRVAHRDAPRAGGELFLRPDPFHRMPARRIRGGN